MAKLLTRKKLDVDSLEKITDESFVRRAKQILGYSVLDTAWTFKKAVQIFNRLGIEPFDDAKVQAYKKQRAEAVHSKKTVGREWNRTTITTRGEWESSTLRNYRREVPAFALLRAAEIKEAFNKAKLSCDFEIDELRLHTTRQRVRPVVDPFMVLVLAGDKRLYIDVWEEPEFEGRRTK